MANTDDCRGVWTKKPKQLPRPVPTSTTQADDIPFEIDPFSMQSILSELMPPQDEMKTGRATLCGPTSSPSSSKQLSSSRRSSLFGGAMRVKAPTESSKKNSMMTPGRMMAKPRIPSSSSQTPLMRSAAKSRVSESIAQDFTDCPDFLLAAQAASGTAPRTSTSFQTPSKPASSSAITKTPGKVLTSVQPIDYTGVRNKENACIDTNRVALTASLPGKSQDHNAPPKPDITPNPTTHFIFEHVDMPLRQEAPLEAKPTLSASLHSAPTAAAPTLRQSASSISTETQKQVTLARTSQSALARLTVTKVEFSAKKTAPVDPSALPFPPTPKRSEPVSKPQTTQESAITSASTASTSVTIEPPVETPAIQAPAPVPIIEFKPSAPSTPKASSSKLTPQRSEVKKTPDFVQRLKLIALERQALLNMLQRLEDEEKKLIDSILAGNA